ncbi:uncharacterized protein LOC108666966 [Hyalella azteca]|uniref:Uncharacterized protein LOC108666966 n=1 Tax=Hyalella azteca TaxID=294128 RepID=A0A8B7N6C9_HYAAZ|nr:uncharacterized protein LOC108666966 [Hyalella azteca]
MNKLLMILLLGLVAVALAIPRPDFDDDDDDDDDDFFRFGHNSLRRDHFRPSFRSNSFRRSHAFQPSFRPQQPAFNTFSPFPRFQIHRRSFPALHNFRNFRFGDDDDYFDD